MSGFLGESRIEAPQGWIDRVDELAEALGVEPNPHGLGLVGKSGKTYALVDLMAAHVALMSGMATSTEGESDSSRA